MTIPVLTNEANPDILMDEVIRLGYLVTACK